MPSKLYDRYYHELMMLFPSANDFMKLPQYKHLQKHFENSLSKEHRARLLKLLKKYKALLSKQKKAGQFDHFDRVFEYDLNMNIEGMKLPFHLMPVDQFTNFVLDYAETMNGGGLYEFKTKRDWIDFFNKTREFGIFCRQAIKNMREGMKKRVVIPKVMAIKMLGQFNTVLREKSYINKKVPKSLQKKWDKMVEEHYIKPVRALRRFVEDEYIDKCRETIGYKDLPNGKAMYKFLLKDETTLSTMTPEMIHKTGMGEVKRLLGEMRKVQKQKKFKGTLAEFMEHLSTEKKYKFNDTKQLFRDYKAMQTYINKNIMPKYFDLPISHDYLIKEVPKFKEAFSPAAYYMPGDVSGKRKGTFYLNTRDVKNMAMYETEVLSLHEGNPGHHYQLTIMMDSKTIPSFVKLSGYNAYSEGWGLYSENFGTYKDPLQYFGKLNYEMLRSIRLVVDTGMHYFGWSFEKAKKYFMDNSTTPEKEIESELYRYLAIPGQACSYKVGELFFLAMRKKYKGDLKKFHRIILKDGPCPLDILRAKLAREYGHSAEKVVKKTTKKIKKKKASKRR